MVRSGRKNFVSCQLQQENAIFSSHIHRTQSAPAPMYGRGGPRLREHTLPDVTGSHNIAATLLFSSVNALLIVWNFYSCRRVDSICRAANGKLRWKSASTVGGLVLNIREHEMTN